MPALLLANADGSMALLLLGVNRRDLLSKLAIILRSLALTTLRPGVVSAACQCEDTAHGLDRELPLMRCNERESLLTAYFFGGCAK